MLGGILIAQELHAVGKVPDVNDPEIAGKARHILGAWTPIFCFTASMKF